MTELNPNHPVTQKIHDHWHKIVGILLARMPGCRTEITEREIDEWGAKYEGHSVVVKDSQGKLTLWIAGPEESKKLAREEGGLPVWLIAR